MLSTRRILLLAGLLLCSTVAYAQTGAIDGNDTVVRGSLTELRSMRRVLLLVRRSVVVDTREQAESILKEVYRSDGDTAKRFPWTYNSIARRLNRYMTKYQSISGARTFAEAEFIIYFNLLEFRRPLGRPYAYGELYVILNGRPNSRPRIVWKARKSPIWVEDAMDDLLKELKATRGEG